jgi:hypothetical protein
MYFCGIVVAGAALAGIGYTLTMDDQASGVPAMLAVLCGLAGVGGAAMILSGTKTRVVLHADAIEVFGLYRESRLARAEILGLRVAGGYIRLVPRQTSAAALVLPPSLAMDEAFHAWFSGIDDLNAQDRQASLDGFLRDDLVPGSNEEKIQHLNVARRVASIVTYAAFAASAWAMFYPHPYNLAILANVLLPWVAVFIAATDGVAYRLNPMPNDIGAHLLTPLLLPGFVLGLRAIFDVELLDWGRAAGYTAAATVVCGLLMMAFVSELRTSGKGVSSLALCLVAYAFGAVTLANTRLDYSEAERYPVEILDMRITTGGGTIFYLKVTPWGPRKEPEEVAVARAFYDSVAKGATVCVYVFPGALKVRWYEVWNCPRD